VAGWLLVIGIAGAASAQQPPSALPPAPGRTDWQSVPQPLAPAGHEPPLLYVKLIGPPGMQATFATPGSPGLTFATPCTIGIRPGYCARVALTVPGFPDTAFFPTLEAHGSLLVSNPADFPAALVFRYEDFARAKADASIKKLVVLERPDTAIPVATRPDEPFEIAVPPSRDPQREAAVYGVPALVMHMGERQLTLEELANVPGTVLLPGEKALGPPAQAPCLTWNCFPVLPPELIKVPDGGDIGLQAGFDRQGKLRGLDPTDTVAEYRDSHGRRRLAVSNRVAVCIPRFVIVKTEVVPVSEVALTGPGGLRTVMGYASVKIARPTLEYSQKAQPEITEGSRRASANVQTIGTAVTGLVQGAVVVGNVYALKSIEAPCLPLGPEVEGPLIIIKWPDRYCALVGDIVTFTLKYTNTGGRPITDVIVSDSLATRFQYVPGTAKADRESIFTTQPNEAGSLVLRWQIPGTLQPRESGVITFQVRVR
jgi:uncharacterized repeat protein (TIGR01451 family)